MHWHQVVGDSVLESNISTSQPSKPWLKGDWLREESYRLRMVCSKVLPPSAKGSLYVSPKPFPLSLHWPCVQTNQTTCRQRDQSQSVHLADPETPLSAKWQKKTLQTLFLADIWLLGSLQRQSTISGSLSTRTASRESEVNSEFKKNPRILIFKRSFFIYFFTLVICTGVNNTEMINVGNISCWRDTCFGIQLIANYIKKNNEIKKSENRHSAPHLISQKSQLLKGHRIIRKQHSDQSVSEIKTTNPHLYISI